MNQNLNNTYISYWLRRFLQDYVIVVRNLSSNTRLSYRDTMRMLLPYLASVTGSHPEKLKIDQLSSQNVIGFLKHIEGTRNISPASRNQRLSSILAFGKFISANNPEYGELYRQLTLIPKKKCPKPMIGYLERDEIEAILSTPDKTSKQGYRDYLILLFMYNTGARVDEVVNFKIIDYDYGNSIVTLHGKGNKDRRCPLWKSTNHELKRYLENTCSKEYVFLNRLNRQLTRFGIYNMITKYAELASDDKPSIGKKHVTPHVIRHTTATHLLQAGVDINTIRAWLGHVSINTTNVYAEVSMKAKADALDCCEVIHKENDKSWKKDQDIMSFLNSLYK